MEINTTDSHFWNKSKNMGVWAAKFSDQQEASMTIQSNTQKK